MLINLTFDVEFNSTGKSFSGNHSFEKGMTAIVGANEGGKSLRLEMIRFALFGTKALRGDSKSYKKITSIVIFELGDNRYTVTRSLSKASLIKEEQLMATGTSPVNQAIIKLFGYPLEVFDITNAILQGQVEDMTNKKPSERKKMVDSTLGLDMIDNLITEVSQELLLNKKLETTYAGQLIKDLIEPEMPTFLYDTKEEHNNIITLMEESNTRLAYLKGILEGNACSSPEPMKPELDTKGLTLDMVQEKLAQIEQSHRLLYQSSMLIINDQQRMDMVLKPYRHCIEEILRYKKEDYDSKWDQYNDYEKNRVEKPQESKEWVLALEEYKRIAEHNASIKDHITCPKCATDICITKTNEVIEPIEYEDTYDFIELFKNNFSHIQKRINELNHQWELYDRFIALPEIEKPELDKKLYSNKDQVIEYYEVELNQSKSFQDSIKEQTDYLNQCVGQWDAEKVVLKTFRDYFIERNIEQKNYDKELKKYTDYIKLKNQYHNEILSLEERIIDIKPIKASLESFNNYHNELTRYQDKVKSQTEIIKVIEEVKEKISELELVKKSLNQLKPKVKTYLMPSLNKVASRLLNQMTGGIRTAIQVDDEFNIFVDGQDVSELSGSGKAVANLAVRIALGTVLTNKVFSVLLADEIDASMDKDRAAYTAECLKNLSSTINQIILVSHQKPEANNYIEV